MVHKHQRKILFYDKSFPMKWLLDVTGSSTEPVEDKHLRLWNGLEIDFVLLLKIRWRLHSCFTLFSPCLAPAGARESGGGETQGGGAEEEVWGERETDPQSARKPERTANPATAKGEWLSGIQCTAFSETQHGNCLDENHTIQKVHLRQIINRASSEDSWLLTVQHQKLFFKNIINTNMDYQHNRSVQLQLPRNCGNQTSQVM